MKEAKTLKASVGNVDLIALAREMAITQTGTDLSTRSTRAAHARRDRRLRIGAIAALIVAPFAVIGALWRSLTTGTSPSEQTVLLACFAGGACLLASMMLAGGLLNTAAFRRLLLGLKRMTSVGWYLMVGLASVGIAFSSFSAGATIYLHMNGYAALSFAGLASVCAVLAAQCSMATTTLLGPLVTVAPRPRHGRALVAQSLWTATLITTVVSALATIIAFNPSETYQTLVITAAIGLVTSIAAWHAICVRNLRHERARILALLTEAMMTIRESDNSPVVSVQRAILALQNHLAPGPFQSTSPVTGPAIASFEIVEVTQFVLSRIGLAPTPDSVLSRRHLDDPHSAVFEAAIQAPTINLLESYERLLDLGRQALLDSRKRDAASSSSASNGTAETDSYRVGVPSRGF